MKKTKPRLKEFRTFTLPAIFKSSAKFVYLYKRTILVWALVNYALLFIFKLIPNGWTNSLSILWLIAYYIFWCVFIRYIQQRPPYFSLIRIFNGLIPVSKIMFINISIYLVLVVLPYIPLFMGFRDKYLEFFEQYMGIMESYNSLPGKTLFYLFMLLVSPYTISRPYLAWVAALVGRSRSILDAYGRTHGNYWNFVFCAIAMSVLLEISYYIDILYNIDTLIYLMSILTIYFTIVFINIYKVFYKRKPRQKSLTD